MLKQVFWEDEYLQHADKCKLQVVGHSMKIRTYNLQHVDQINTFRHVMLQTLTLQIRPYELTT